MAEQRAQSTNYPAVSGTRTWDVSGVGRTAADAVANGRAAALSGVGWFAYLYALVMPAGTLTDCIYVPCETIVGDATNTRRFELLAIGAFPNKVANGGSVVVAELELGAGDTAPAGVPLEIPIVDTTADGDRLCWRTVKVGTGAPDPGGCLTVRANGVGALYPGSFGCGWYSGDWSE